MTDLTEDFLQATRTSYDAIAKDYTARFPSGLLHPLDHTLIATFAELVTANGRKPVADLGSGPGYVTALLHDHGAPAFGVDLSPIMVGLAREAHPRLRFHVSSMTSLDLPDGTWVASSPSTPPSTSPTPTYRRPSPSSTARCSRAATSCSPSSPARTPATST